MPRMSKASSDRPSCCKTEDIAILASRCPGARSTTDLNEGDAHWSMINGHCSWISADFIIFFDKHMRIELWSIIIKVVIDHGSGGV